MSAARSKSTRDDGPFWVHSVAVVPIKQDMAADSNSVSAIQFTAELESLSGGLRSVEIGMPISVMRDTLIAAQDSLASIRRVEQSDSPGNV